MKNSSKKILQNYDLCLSRKKGDAKGTAEIAAKLAVRRKGLVGNMKRTITCFKRSVLIMLCMLVSISCSGCGAQKAKTNLDPKNPVTVTVWNYYNGDQLSAFENLVDEFNSTEGIKKGIVIEGVSQGNVTTLADSLLSSVNGEAGAQERPSLAAVYSETAYILDQKDELVNLDDYFTAEELAAYVPGFLEEGRFNADNALMLFPILKSTEIFTANETDWAPFESACGISLESIDTNEALTAASKKYYEWTDSETPDIPNDGKALYGRDSVANYIYVGAKQLGHEIFVTENGKTTVDMDRETFKTLWDNYYIPFIRGYFGAYGKFRSEDCKTGKILALTSSTSSTSYLPTTVTTEDDLTYEITTYERGALPFENAVNNAVVQQGASYCLLKSTPAQQEGAVEFLKWFTVPERNMDFALMSGYSPVTVSSNTKEAVTNAFQGDVTSPKDINVLKSLQISADTFLNDTPFSTKPFSGGKEVRVVLEDALKNTAITDREAVEAALQNGETLDSAVAVYSSDAYFESWFTSLCSDVNKTIKAE